MDTDGAAARMSGATAHFLISRVRSSFGPDLGNDPRGGGTVSNFADLQLLVGARIPPIR